jgi:mRNA interferase RelE/StbE
MAYTISVERRAAKFLRGISDTVLLRRLRSAIRGLTNEPRPTGSIKLQGERDLYRIRVGDYRIIYQIQDAVLIVLVVQIGHRREIYRSA